MCVQKKEVTENEEENDCCSFDIGADFVGSFSHTVNDCLCKNKIAEIKQEKDCHDGGKEPKGQTEKCQSKSEVDGGKETSRKDYKEERKV